MYPKPMTAPECAARLRALAELMDRLPPQARIMTAAINYDQGEYPDAVQLRSGLDETAAALGLEVEDMGITDMGYVHREAARKGLTRFLQLERAEEET